MPVGRLLSFSWSQKALWSRKEIHPAPLRFTVLSTWGVFQAGHENLALVCCWFFFAGNFPMRLFFFERLLWLPYFDEFHTRCPSFSSDFHPPRGNNSAVRSGLRPTVIPAAEVGGWWLVVSGWWLAISRVIFTNSISRELGCLLKNFTWKWKWIRWIQRGLFSKCFTRR